MDIFKEFATDDDKELNGSVVEIGPGVSLLVARANNRRFNRRIIKLYEEHAQVLNTAAEDGPERDAADARDAEIMATVMAETILLGWEGLQYKGQPIEHSVDNAKMMLMHKEFRKFVEKHAQNLDHFKLASEEEQVKNS